MADNHIITREIGNLRGFSTDSIFVRPSNVADEAINLQRAPDRTFQIRRGYQCQISEIGGLGNGTFDDPQTDEIHTVCVGLNGFLYNKLTRQIYFYYNGQVTGTITGAIQANPCEITSPNHGLQTGAQLILRNIGGMVELNNTTVTITVTSPSTFTLDGVDSTSFTPYTSGGEWSIAFADQRYLTFTIFTDPRYLVTNQGWNYQIWSLSPWGSPSGESITCNITVNRAAQVNGNFNLVNTVNVEFGHELEAGDTIQFYASNGVFNQRVVVSVTPTSITFDGFPVSMASGAYLNQFFDIRFGKGFDVNAPYLISTFLATITDPTNGVHGLQVAWNGEDDLPAAFLQIIEPIIIVSNRPFSIDYWYWQQINATLNPPLPGSANIQYQNSPQFENASMAAFDDVIYVANGWDFPQKYDGQTVYRAGMPQGRRTLVADNTSSPQQPFTVGQVYEYAITYEQIDNRGHIVEGALSEIRSHTVGAATAALDVTVDNIPPGSGWNTNGAIATGGLATSYGPDSNGFYYDFVLLNPGFTLKIGDSAYYENQTVATVNGAQSDVNTIDLDAGHQVLVGDTVYFLDSSNDLVVRQVTFVTDTSITIEGDPVTVSDNTEITAYKVSLVFGNVAIVDGEQSNVSTLNVVAGSTIAVNDVVEFIDTSQRIQRRTVTATTGTSITIDGIPVSVANRVLIASLTVPSSGYNFQVNNFQPITLPVDGPISNNLRINIYRTFANTSFGVDGELYLVASIPNNSQIGGVQIYTDIVRDSELQTLYEDPLYSPAPPPISKYVKAFGNQMFYAGGQRNNPLNSDRIFFSEGNRPEIISEDRETGVVVNAFNVPNVDDDVTGIGVSGTTIVVTKNHSLWAATGNFLSGQIDVVQIAPGTNIGCVAHATLQSVGTLLYFLHTNGVYAITENQLYPTDPFGNPIPLSIAIDSLFRVTPYLPQMRFQLKRAVAVNYTKDNQYLLFLPCEDVQTTIRTANAFSQILCYDYQDKNWFQWFNINAAGGFVVINDDLYFQERRFSAVDGNVANLYKQHRFYRLVDHADHAGPQRVSWKSSWEDLGQPEVRKKFCRAILLMDRVSELFQYNNPKMIFSSYLDRLPNLQNTIAPITQTDNIRNSSWSYSGWGWNIWAGYQDSFVTINLRQGTVAKSMQIGFSMQGINMDIRLAGFQLEAIPENRKTVVR